MNTPAIPPLRLRSTWTLALATIALAGAGCTMATEHHFTEPVTLAGHELSADTLNLGRQDYITFCIQCHGELGDGRGHAGVGLMPPPRNFRQAQFKFAFVDQGDLPPDDELMRIVKGGLNGTPMRQWDISDERLRAIVHYIKTFSAPETGWKEADSEPADLLEISDNPYGPAERDAAVELGKQVYHAYQCNSCHPTYVRPQEIERLTEALLGTAIAPTLRENWHRTQLKESSYWYRLKPEALEKTHDELNEDDWEPARILPPDFTWHLVRTVQPSLSREDQVTQFYRIVAAGINGAAMPAWKEVMPEDRIWALAYYLQWLTELRDTPERAALWEQAGVDPAQDMPAYPPPSTG